YNARIKHFELCIRKKKRKRKRKNACSMDLLVINIARNSEMSSTYYTHESRVDKQNPHLYFSWCRCRPAINLSSKKWEVVKMENSAHNHNEREVLGMNGGGGVKNSLSVQLVSPQCFNMLFQLHKLSTHFFNLGSLTFTFQCPSV
ncbi:hypothetical protein TorRG33x02_219980, partial [Trema orientale]